MMKQHMCEPLDDECFPMASQNLDNQPIHANADQQLSQIKHQLPLPRHVDEIFSFMLSFFNS
jgi:hypothetical protein